MMFKALLRSAELCPLYPIAYLFLFRHCEPAGRGNLAFAWIVSSPGSPVPGIFDKSGVLAMTDYFIMLVILVQKPIFTTEAQRTQRRVFVSREIPRNKKILFWNPYRLLG